MGYENGKIYKIVDKSTGSVYIGSTKQTLEARLDGHERDIRCNSKRLSKSSKILESGNYDICLLESYPCENKKELETRESLFILEALKTNSCVNKVVPTRTMKQWYEDNKERLRAKKRDYYHKNKEKLSERDKRYKEANKEKIKLYLENYHKEWYKENKEKALANAKKWGYTLVKCEECGHEMKRHSVSYHKKQHLKNKNLG